MSLNTSQPSTLRGDLPPLRIHHFLAWTAVIAVMLALVNGSLQMDPWRPSYYIVFVVLYMVGSASMACLGFGAFWWWRGLRFPAETGHGLVILCGVECLFWKSALAAYTAVYLHDNPAQLAEGAKPSVPRWVDVASFWRLTPIIYLTLAVLAIVLAVRLVCSWRWRTVFALVVLVDWLHTAYDGLLRSLFRITQSGILQEWWRSIQIGVGTLPTIILLLVLLLAVMDDRRRGAAFHWSHWVGVGTAAASGANLLGWYVFSILSTWLN